MATDDSDDDAPVTPRHGIGVSELTEARLLRLERSHERHARQYAIDRALLHGADGQPGRLASLEAGVRTASNAIDQLERWRIGLTAKIAAGIAIGTPIAGIVTALVVRWLSR